MFSKHHYLNHSHNNASQVYIGFVNDEIASFLSVIHFPHPKSKNIKRVHRLVVLPDYQGAGIGLRMLNEIGDIYLNNKYRYTIVTSAPSLIYSLKNSKHWRCSSYGRKTNHGGLSNKNGKLGSQERITASFEKISK